MDALTRAVGKALSRAPVSLRKVGLRAEVSHAQLARIVAGERTATPAVALAVVAALDSIARECHVQSERVRRSLTIHYEGGR